MLFEQILLRAGPPTLVNLFSRLVPTLSRVLAAGSLLLALWPSLGLSVYAHKRGAGSLSSKNRVRTGGESILYFILFAVIA